MVPVSTLLSTAGASLTGWTLAEVHGISTDGAVIAGAGVHNGLQEAWISSLPHRCGSADFNLRW